MIPYSSSWFDFANAEKWIHAELIKQGIQITGPLDQFYARPWSILIRIPSSSGNIYFKAVSPESRHEVALMVKLHQWHPECTLPVIASHLGQGWLLTPDGGTTLREAIRGSQDFRHWQSVLPIYARLQIDLTRHIEEIFSIGEPDRRLKALPGQYEALLQDHQALYIDQKDGISSEQVQRLQALVPDFAAMCAELETSGIPETLNHGDLTDGNIFLSNGHAIFFDWGDSVISHPFFSLRTTFVSLYFSMGIDYGAPELDVLRDIYLEAWKEYGALDELRAAFQLALKVAPISRALDWQRATSKLQGSEKAEYGFAVPSLLQEFLELL